MNSLLSFSQRGGRPFTLVASATFLLASLVLVGCASSPHQLARPDGPEVVPLNLISTRGPASATLHTIIDPKGPGSWKYEAFWDEMVISIANAGKVPLRVESAILLDVRGHAMSPGRDPWALEEESRGGLGIRARVSAASRIPSGYVLPTSIGLAGTSIVYGSVGLKGPSLVYGTAAVALPLYVLASQAADENGKRGIETEFHRRRLVLPTEIEPGESATGSLFFPIAPDFHRLTLRCRAGDQVRIVEFDLTPFAHLYHRP